MTHFRSSLRFSNFLHCRRSSPSLQNICWLGVNSIRGQQKDNTRNNKDVKSVLRFIFQIVIQGHSNANVTIDYVSPFICMKMFLQQRQFWILEGCDVADARCDIHKNPNGRFQSEQSLDLCAWYTFPLEQSIRGTRWFIQHSPPICRSSLHSQTSSIFFSFLFLFPRLKCKLSARIHAQEGYTGICLQCFMEYGFCLVH